ncbi:mitochondrial substrate carrier family protein ucpA-like isoform X2 [Schistocerca gregaria]|uniref:mitochondrial substrate carrier family protein ucpA-like isoform X2 n=1 Tax=Schistocerca gregaria TaxID=7010 RepID=UPI00211DA7F8|nr:mitochondrial substrate carrier family protein ucpA-like isoform X2 [Schistocerca gregaria]
MQSAPLSSQELTRQRSCLGAPLPTWQLLLFGTLAPQMAVVFTNPVDTVRVRMQLDQKTGTTYKSAWDCAARMCRMEGVASLQKGIVPALVREGTKNVFRIGMYEPLLSVLYDRKKGEQVAFWKRAVAGAITGAAGAVACNPFDLIKTRMQADADHPSNAVIGCQYRYSGLTQAIRTIVSEESVLTLYKGLGTSALRSMLGGASSLATYTACRDYFVFSQVLGDCVYTDVLCGFIASTVTAFIMNPIDVVRTNVYSQQGRGGLAAGVRVTAKLFKEDGCRAFFKGLRPNLARLGPHYILTFVFYEQLKRVSRRHASDAESG